jgi:hypothetical protein
MWFWIALVALAPLVIIVMLIRKVAKKYTPGVWSGGVSASQVSP